MDKHSIQENYKRLRKEYPLMTASMALFWARIFKKIYLSLAKIT